MSRESEKPNGNGDEAELRNIRNALEFVRGVQADLKAKTPAGDIQCAETKGTGDTLSDNESGKQAVPGRVGRFEVEGLIGTGGFANVYLATDPDLDRHVAVKILKDSVRISGDTAARFEREARAVATLDHPNIVSIFETGSFQGRQFIASAFCDGTSLKHWLSGQRQVDLQTACRIIATLADAMHHAHQRGIIHRDLKPANILIAKGGSKSDVHPEQLFVTDFGLARLEQTIDQLETTEGAVVGT
ncbi:MAG: serine/threonine-protein kinase, partial [Planctomycetota bacterium]